MNGVKIFVEQKSVIESRIKSLEDERAYLLTEIPKLRAKVAKLRLEAKAHTLQSEVAALQNEKSNLEEELIQYTPHSQVESSHQIEPQVAS